MNQEEFLSNPKRLAALQASGLMDSEPERGFDRITELATLVFETPVALVSLVDETRQFFKSCVGLPEKYSDSRETPLSHSFCQYVVASGSPLIVDDARVHETLKDNPAVKELNVIAYAGVPILSDSGERLGSFCVIDDKPRDWSKEDIRILTCMTRCVQQEIASSKSAAHQVAAIDDAKEVAKRKNLFLAQLSHELRNPLSPILNATQMLVDGTFTEEEKPEIYTLLCQQTKQIVRMVNDMLDLSRVEQGKIKLLKKTIELNHVVESSVDAIRSTALENGHVISIDSLIPNIPVNGDFDRLVQVVSNLLTNACRYTPHGGKISVKCFSGGDVAFLSVEDNGVGIKAAKLPEIFDVFKQLKNGDSTDDNKGLGLGLALVKQLVELHGGTVKAASEGLGRGSTFTVEIPLAGSTDEADNAIDFLNGDNSAIEPLDIVILEDIRAVAFMFRRLLESNGHQVRVASNVAEAHLEIKKRCPQLIFSDIGLPDIDGFQFAQQLRENDATKEVPLVAMTGGGREEDIKRALDSGFTDFLTKPVDIQKVNLVIESLFGKQVSG